VGIGFKAPVAPPPAAELQSEQAVRAALALIDAMAKLDSRLAPALHVRIGIASGLVVAVLGESGHDPVAIGEAPRLAAQLEVIAPPVTIVIAASTRHLVRSLFDYRELRPVSPLYPVISQFERAARFRRDDTPEERFAKFEALVSASIGDEAAALIAALLSVAAGERFLLPNLSPQRRKERTLEALVAQIAALARQRPILAIFEDAHWMDPTSRELLELLVDRARTLPMLLLITSRPEFTPPWANHAHATTMVPCVFGREWLNWAQALTRL
jgi:hypothetical protein